MRLIPVVLAAGLTASPAAAAPTTFEIDPTHTAVAFLVEHIGFAMTLGQFTRIEGSFVYDAEAQSLSDVAVTVDPASVFTNDERRDQHVRNADFLNIEEHPAITFAATEYEVTGENTGKVTGDLTILGITNPIVLDVTLNKDDVYPFGHQKRTLGISARGTVLRSEYGMSYALAGNLVGDEVDLIIEFEAIAAE